MNPALLLIVAALATPSSAQTAEDALAGDWRGDSVCVVRPSACTDEKALYHIRKMAETDRFSIAADKIVNGQPINMGTIDCVYSRETHALNCEFAKGVLHLNLKDRELEGTMHLTDGTLWRNISLKKDGK